MMSLLASLQFEWPWVFAALLLPFLVRWLLPSASMADGALNLPFDDALDPDEFSRSTTGRGRRRWPALLAFLLLVVAAARPVQISDASDVPLTGRDILFAIDISASMGESDWSENASSVTRMAVVRQIISDFIERRRGDRVGVVVFGSNAYLLTPMTFDLDTAAQMVRGTVVGLAGPATAIGDAVGLGIKRLRETNAVHRVIILVSDGEANAGWTLPKDAIRAARAEGVTVYTIGIGTLKKANANALDENTLRDFAAGTGGKYFLARGGGELEGVYAALDQLEPAVVDEALLLTRTEYYPWPLGGALVLAVLLLLRAFLRDRAGAVA